jgi:hypothetical protein
MPSGLGPGGLPHIHVPFKKFVWLKRAYQSTAGARSLLRSPIHEGAAKQQLAIPAPVEVSQTVLEQMGLRAAGCDTRPISHGRHVPRSA